MLEPQSTALFIALMVAFGGLTWWLIVTRQVVFRLLAACVAFSVAVVFGVAAVNKYYGYYQTWGAAVADFAGSGPATPTRLPASKLVTGTRTATRQRTGSYLSAARRQGYTLRIFVTGRRSHITRVVYVYLPPQYFQPAYRRYRFPVIELIHGQPGEPQDWINVVGVTYTLQRLLARKKAKPAVLVMPDANGSERISLQCLNQVGGPQDLTYLAKDLPQRIYHMFRVQRPGPAWGIAGYSEGGYCAANMALRYRHRYGYAGVMSGYFVPFDNQLLHPLRDISPFGGSKKLLRENSPIDELRALPAGALIPQFWLGAGAANQLDVANARMFWQALQLRQAYVPLTLTPGGGHSMVTWRAETPALLEWMTSGLAANARQPEPVAQRAPAGQANAPA